MKNNQVVRLKSIIGKDRLEEIESFSGLFMEDLRGLLSEYFIIKGEPKLNFKREKDCVSIEIILEVTQFKNFINIL